MTRTLTSNLKIRFPRRFQDGWLRVQKVRPKCDHGDALVPGFALIAVGDERLPMPFLNAGFPALLERLRTAPRPLPLSGDFESLFHRAAAVETERDVAGSIAAALSETAPPVNYGKFASDDDASDAAASPRRPRGGSRDDRDASPPPIATYVNPPAAAAGGGDAPPPAVEELLNLAKSFRDYARTSAAADGAGAPPDIASSLRASAWRKEVSLETPGAAAAAPPPPASGAPPAPGGPGGQDNLDFFVWLSGENPSAPPRP